MSVSRVLNLVHLTYDNGADYELMKKEVTALIEGIRGDKDVFGIYFAVPDKESQNQKLELHFAEMFLALPEERSLYVDFDDWHEESNGIITNELTGVDFNKKVDVEFYGIYLYECALQSAHVVAEAIETATAGTTRVKKLVPRGGFKGNAKRQKEGQQVRKMMAGMYRPITIAPLKPVKA